MFARVHGHKPKATRDICSDICSDQAMSVDHCNAKEASRCDVYERKKKRFRARLLGLKYSWRRPLLRDEGSDKRERSAPVSRRDRRTSRFGHRKDPSHGSKLPKKNQ